MTTEIRFGRLTSRTYTVQVGPQRKVVGMVFQDVNGWHGHCRACSDKIAAETLGTDTRQDAGELLANHYMTKHKGVT